MNIKITRTAKKGFQPKTSIFLNGLKYEEGDWFRVSRELTQTDSESGHGILSNTVEGESIFGFPFGRGEDKVFLQFEEFDFHDQPVDKTAQEIKKRVNQVIAAFEKKYPEINETYEFEI